MNSLPQEIGLSIESGLSIEELYRRFHQIYKEAREAEPKVLDELNKDNYSWEIINSYLKARKRTPVDTEPQPVQSSGNALALTKTDLHSLSMLFPQGDFFEDAPDKPIDIKELKKRFLRIKRLQLLKQYIDNITGSANEIRQALDSHLRHAPVSLDFLVQQDKNGLLLAQSKLPISDEDAVLITYAVTGKIPSGYNIFGNGELSPLNYDELLVDAFGGKVLTKGSYSYEHPRIINFDLTETFDNQNGTFRQMEYLMKGISHMVESKEVVSNACHVPLGISLQGDRVDRDTKYFAIVLSQEQFRFVVAQPSDLKVTDEYNVRFSNGYSAYRNLSPQELGEYLGNFAEPLGKQGKIKITFELT